MQLSPKQNQNTPVEALSSNQIMMMDEAKKALVSPGGSVASSGSSTGGTDNASSPVTTKRRSSGISKKASAKLARELEGKPRRPLSSYNLFFKHARAKILEERPSKYEPGKPRRSHGKIGFASLARNIAAQWNNIDPEERKKFDQLAAEDKERYNREMEVWKEEQAIKKSAAVNHRFDLAAACMVDAGQPCMSGMNAHSIIKSNLMAAQQGSGNMMFNRFLPGQQFPVRVSNNFLPGDFFGNNMNNVMCSDYGPSGVVGQALDLLDDDYQDHLQMSCFQPLDEPTLHRVEAEDSQPSSRRSSFTESGSGGVRRNSTPHISELAAKLDEECMGLMTDLLA